VRRSYSNSASVTGCQVENNAVFGILINLCTVTLNNNVVRNVNGDIVSM
jgi:hypothetical protein